LKDNKVRVFGGHSESANVNSCEAFDLNTKVWIYIVAMPAVAYSTTAVLWIKLSFYLNTICHAFIYTMGYHFCQW